MQASKPRVACMVATTTSETFDEAGDPGLAAFRELGLLQHGTLG